MNSPQAFSPGQVSPFHAVMDDWPAERVDELLASRNEADVRRALRGGGELDIERFAALISPSAQPLLEEMAQAARSLTGQRFGNVMHLYAPLYLSNICENRCRYCGFSSDRKFPRVTLTPEQTEEEAAALAEIGFRHILLLTGEAPGRIGMDFLESAVRQVLQSAPTVSLEVWPLSAEEYACLAQAGASGVTVYQETYDRETYTALHPSGRKADYDWRLGTPDRAGAAGMRRLNIGALLGLAADWRREAFYTALHARHLAHCYWKSQVSVSFPRLRPMGGSFTPGCTVDDRDLVQFVCAARLFGPDLGLVLSTREPAHLRDRLIHLGFTQMSAQSSTRPGGYGGCGESEEQFSPDDTRSLSTMTDILRREGFDPVFKDWDESPLVPPAP